MCGKLMDVRVNCPHGVVLIFRVDRDVMNVGSIDRLHCCRFRRVASEHTRTHARKKFSAATCIIVTGRHSALSVDVDRRLLSRSRCHAIMSCGNVPCLSTFPSAIQGVV